MPRISICEHRVSTDILPNEIMVRTWLMSGTVPAVFLVSVKRGSLDAVRFGYDGNYLASISQGAMRENIAFEKNGRTARITGDGDFAYSYENGGVSLRDKANRAARCRYDAKNGVFSISDFTGRKATIYYFMRYDVAYLGKVRKIVDGEGNDLVSYRYDAKSGNVTRVRDRFGNDRDFEYDSEGRLAKASRRAQVVTPSSTAPSMTNCLGNS